MPNTPKTMEENSCNKCVSCGHIGEKCVGPNFLTMTIERICEWCRLRKEYLHTLDSRWTNAYVAEKAGISKNTVDRFLGGTLVDIKVSSLSYIIQVLLNGAGGQLPCTAGEPEVVYVDNPALIDECKRQQEALSVSEANRHKQTDFLMDQLAIKDEQLASKDVQLAEYAGFTKRKNRLLTLVMLLGILGWAIIITALILDRIDPTRGFFWLDTIEWSGGSFITDWLSWHL